MQQYPVIPKPALPASLAFEPPEDMEPSPARGRPLGGLCLRRMTLPRGAVRAGGLPFLPFPLGSEGWWLQLSVILGNSDLSVWDQSLSGW